MKLIDSSKLRGAEMHNQKKLTTFVDKLLSFQENTNIKEFQDLFGVERGTSLWNWIDINTEFLISMKETCTVKEFQDLIATINQS